MYTHVTCNTCDIKYPHRALVLPLPGLPLAAGGAPLPGAGATAAGVEEGGGPSPSSQFCAADANMINFSEHIINLIGYIYIYIYIYI